MKAKMNGIHNLLVWGGNFCLERTLTVILMFYFIILFYPAIIIFQIIQGGNN